MAIHGPAGQSGESDVRARDRQRRVASDTARRLTLDATLDAVLRDFQQQPEQVAGYLGELVERGMMSEAELEDLYPGLADRLGGTFAARALSQRDSGLTAREVVSAITAGHPAEARRDDAPRTECGLPADVRAQMEAGLGADFREVRVHTDSHDAAALGARAYAQGADLHFAPGQYDPGSRSGRELIGHELAHVVQQASGRVAGSGVTRDAGLEREADRLGSHAAGLAPSPASLSEAPTSDLLRPRRSSVMQLDGPDLSPQPVTVAVPAVQNIGAITDTVARNHAINQSYHTIDTSMEAYAHPLDGERVSNWYTYGQHASREAGVQIRNLEAGLRTLRETLASLTRLTLSGLNPVVVAQEAQRAVTLITRVLGLLSQGGLVEQGIRLAMAQAGISESELQGVVDAGAEVLATDFSELIMPALHIIDLMRFVGRLEPVVAKLIVAIPAIITSLTTIYNNMVQGNREIYENVAPAAAQFLAAANAAADGVPASQTFAGDTNGYLRQAFVEYGESKHLFDQARAYQGAGMGTQATTAKQQAYAKAHHANLLVGFQEQLVILQPIFDTMRTELDAMSGTMVITDPNGVHPLIADWADFYTRMGIDPTGLPTDPNQIRPQDLPPTLRPGDPNYAGTIADYFETYVADGTIHDAPRANRRAR